MQRVDAGVADVGIDAVLLRPAHGGVVRRRVGPARVARHAGRRRAGIGGVRAAPGQEEGQRRDERGQHPAHGYSFPRSSGRASLRPWWIWAFTVPRGIPISWAMSS